MGAALHLQQRLNVIRLHRGNGPLTPLEETGRPNKFTRAALRAFQHEHNMFVGRKVLKEQGQLDHDTELALSWWMDLFKEEAAA